MHPDTLSLMVSILTGINDGYAIANTPVEVVQEYAKLTNFDPNNKVILSLLESIMMVGSAIGCATTSLYVGKYGLTKSIFMLYVLNLIVNILEPIPVHYSWLIVMRGISGFFASSISAVSPLLMAIMLDPYKRGKAVMAYTIAMNTGILFAYFMNLFISFDIRQYWLMFLVSVVVSIVTLVDVSYLLKYQRKMKISDQNLDLQALEDMLDEGSHEENKSESVEVTQTTYLTIKQMQDTPLTKKQYGRLLYIALALGFMQMMTGVDAICVYASKIFEKTLHCDKSGIYGSIILGSTNLIGTIFVAPFAERKPRKTMLMIGVVGVGAMNILIGILYLLKVSEIAILVIILVDYIFFNIGPEPIVYMILSELFPEKYKYKLNSYGYTMNWIGCILSVFIIDFFLDGTEYIVYWIFAACTLGFGISATLLCPETFNKKLTDIEKEIRKWGVKKTAENERLLDQQDQDAVDYSSEHVVVKQPMKVHKKKSLSVDTKQSIHGKTVIRIIDTYKLLPRDAPVEELKRVESQKLITKEEEE